MILSTLLFAAAVAAPPSVAYVDANLTTGANDGSSWANAFRGPLGLQAALATDAPTIWVADGTYYPGPVGSPASTTFQVSGSRTVIGGFAGGERGIWQVDPIANVAVLSGDLPGGPAGQPELEAIMTIVGGVEWLTIDGLTFDVSLSGPTQNAGGPRRAIVIDQSEGVRILHCTIRDGRAPKGGGVRVTQSEANFFQCTIENNTADQAGGGVHADATSETYYGDCLIRNNIGGRGAGLYLGAETGAPAAGSFPSLGGCTFENNLGVIGAASGGGLYCRGVVAEMADCTFIHCIVPGGGGAIFSEDSNLGIDRSRFIDCAAAGDGGGAIYANSTQGPGWQTVDLGNCLFTGNHNALFAANGASIVAEYSTIANGRAQPGQALFFPAIVATGQTASEIILRNSIVWGNATVSGASVGGNVFALGGSTVTIERSDAQGWNGPSGSVNGSENFSANPNFVDSDGADGLVGNADDDLRLRLVSPCIDAANEEIVELEFFAGLDLAKNDRPFDVASVADTGSGYFGFGDLGCFERSPSDCPLDLNVDGAVDAADIAVLLGEWGQRWSDADFDNDRAVDASDLAILLGGFGNSCP
ncbi:MAG: hypothetical protein JNM94_05725 [Phycisphaerae bacterium]|nr:hypothetical protein [Phycisphaerae bacterium]